MLIDRLPRDSYFVEALLNDDEFADLMPLQPDMDIPQERLTEWSPLREGLARIEDQLRNLTSAVIASGGGKPPEFQPAVRPITAADRSRHRRRRMEHESLVARVLPQQ